MRTDNLGQMQRTQIHLEPELAASLDRLARRRGTSRAALIREACALFVAEADTPEEDSILGIIGLGHGGASDVSERHDDYLVAYKLEKLSH